MKMVHKSSKETEIVNDLKEDTNNESINSTLNLSGIYLSHDGDKVELPFGGNLESDNILDCADNEDMWNRSDNLSRTSNCSSNSMTASDRPTIKTIDLNDVEFEMDQSKDSDNLLIKVWFKSHRIRSCDYDRNVLGRKSICINLEDINNINYLLKIAPTFDCIKQLKTIELINQNCLSIHCVKNLPIWWPSLIEKKELLSSFLIAKFNSNFTDTHEIESPKSFVYKMPQREYEEVDNNDQIYSAHEDQLLHQAWPRKRETRFIGLPQLRGLPQFGNSNISAPTINQLGYTGLDNLGNTCFMNAVLQCLSNTDELRDFFLDPNLDKSLNYENPFSSNGNVAISFHTIVSQLWSGKHSSYSPEKFKELISSKMNKFEGNAQEDSVEFMEIFLDLLHEDLNRVDRTKKIIVDPLPKEEDEMTDCELASVMWQRHLKYNDSLIVDFFHGQLKSNLTCTVCKKNSITFDPFLFLPVPLPKPQITYQVFYFGLDYSKKPLKVSVTSNQDVKCSGLIEQVCDKFKVNASCLKLIASGDSEEKFIDDDEQLSLYDNCDLLIFQLKDKEECNEPVYNFFVRQYRFTNISKNYLDYSTSDSDYWSLNDWSIDQMTRPKYFVHLGKSFMVSFTKSELNFKNLRSAIKNRSRHSIDINLFEIKIQDNLKQVPTGSTNSLESQESNGESADFPLTNDSTIELKVKPFKVGNKIVNVVRKIETMNEINFEKYFDIFLNNDPNKFESLSVESDFDAFLDTISDFNNLIMQWKDDKDSNYRLRVNSKDLDHSANYYELLNQNNEKNTTTLEDCLSMFTAQEELSSEDYWHCPKCKKPQKANKQLTIWRLPKILIIQLKRFSFKQSTRDKIDNFIEFPLRDLDLKNYCSDSIKNELEGKTLGKTKYNLYGVINHFGGIYGGHYTATAKTIFEDKEYDWRLFDDYNVDNIDENMIVTPNAYTLFYRRTDCDIVKQN